MISENEKMFVKNMNDTIFKKAERTEKNQKNLRKAEEVTVLMRSAQWRSQEFLSCGPFPSILRSGQLWAIKN